MYILRLRAGVYEHDRESLNMGQPVIMRQNRRTEVLVKGHAAGLDGHEC